MTPPEYLARPKSVPSGVNISHTAPALSKATACAPLWPLQGLAVTAGLTVIPEAGVVTPRSPPLAEYSSHPALFTGLTENLYAVLANKPFAVPEKPVVLAELLQPEPELSPQGALVKSI